MEYEENNERDYENISSSTGEDIDLFENLREGMTKILGLPKESTLDQIDQAMQKKYPPT